MIGVAKNQSVRTLASRSRMSLKCTASADNASARPSVKINCTRTTTGNHGSDHGFGKCWNAIMNAASIKSPRAKWTMFARTLTIGSTSAGNKTFLMRLPPLINDEVASVRDAANHVHGRRPQNMKTAYGRVRGSLFGMMVLNTNE